MERRPILLIEDNEDDIELTIRAFKKSNIANEIVILRDGVEALDYLKGNGSYRGRDTAKIPGLALLDLKLPRIGGLEVLKEIREDEKTAWLPVIVLTSSKEDQDLVKSYQGGANSYIRKPVDFERFSEAVRQLGLYWLVLNEPPPSRGDI